MLHVLVACFLSMAPQPRAAQPASLVPQGPATALDTLLQDSTCAFRARVVERKVLREDAPYTRGTARSLNALELEITRPVLGGVLGEHVAFLATNPPRDRPALQVGDEALFFLRRRSGASEFSVKSLRQKTRLWAGSRTIYGSIANGVWRFHKTGEVLVPNALGVLCPDLPQTAERVPLPVLLEFLDRRFEDTCPTARAHEVSNGISPWHIRVDAKGKLSGERQIPAPQWEAFWESVRRERFFDLPEELGRSPHPDSLAYEIVLRTKAHGTIAVCSHVLDPDALAADDPLREPAQSFARLWQELHELERAAPPR